MKKKKLFCIPGLALLLAAAFPACTQSDDEPGTGPEGKILVSPSVGLEGWNGNDTPGTRADQQLPVTLAEGGKLGVGLFSVGSNGAPDFATSQLNWFAVTAVGKLSRIPYQGGDSPGNNETEAPLNIGSFGEYYFIIEGDLRCTTDGITYNGFVGTAETGIKVNIGTDGKVSLPCAMRGGGLRLNVKNSDGSAYTGADVTASLKNLLKWNNTALSEEQTLTTAAPAAIWGNIKAASAVTTGTALIGLTVSGKTYEVKAPRNIIFTAARLLTFNVRVGATSVTVSSDDLSVPDFEVQPATNAEAEYKMLYEGQECKELVTAGTAYYIAPVHAQTNVQWADINFDTVCPEGWHVPTVDDFLAMTESSGTNDVNQTHKVAVGEAFGGTHKTEWTATEKDANNAWFFTIGSDGDLGFNSKLKTGETSGNNVRCVRKKYPL